jgi:hypothetical protein
MDIKVMLELGNPGLLAFTLTEQKVVTADPGGHKLFKDVSAQDESDTVGGVTGIKPFLQKKDRLTVPKAELSGGGLTVESKQPEFEVSVFQQGTTQIKIKGAARSGSEASRLASQLPPFLVKFEKFLAALWKVRFLRSIVDLHVIMTAEPPRVPFEVISVLAA